MYSHISESEALAITDELENLAITPEEIAAQLGAINDSRAERESRKRADAVRKYVRRETEPFTVSVGCLFPR
jgi:hypothetical protein